MKQVLEKAEVRRNAHIRPFRKLALAATIIAAGIFASGCQCGQNKASGSYSGGSSSRESASFMQDEDRARSDAIRDRARFEESLDKEAQQRKEERDHREYTR